jgi:hypothetical protein
MPPAKGRSYSSQLFKISAHHGKEREGGREREREKEEGGHKDREGGLCVWKFYFLYFVAASRE